MLERRQNHRQKDNRGHRHFSEKFEIKKKISDLKICWIIVLYLKLNKWKFMSKITTKQNFLLPTF